jgi:hypothetical protein
MNHQASFDAVTDDATRSAPSADADGPKAIGAIQGTAGKPADKKVATKKSAARKPPAPKAAAKSAPAPAKKAVTAKKAPKSEAVPKASAKPAKKPAKLRTQLVRDSFTMPEAEFGLIAALKAKALDARRAAKKSELLRAGLQQLAGLDARALAAALDKLEPVKIGRPKKGH